MKRFFHMTILFVAVVSVFVSCKKEYESTIVNLKVSITHETNSRAKYLAFAEKAEEEGYKSIANMFRAVAKAESIHARSHNDVLIKLGELEFTATAETPTVKSTIENLQAAIDDEKKEYTVTYPGFIATAKKEKCNNAIETFTLANLAEENHEMRFSEVLKAIENKQTVPLVFFVCARCGGMFTNHFSKCGICQTDTERQYYVPLVFDVH